MGFSDGVSEGGWLVPDVGVPQDARLKQRAAQRAMVKIFFIIFILPSFFGAEGNTGPLDVLACDMYIAPPCKDLMVIIVCLLLDYIIVLL